MRRWLLLVLVLLLPLRGLVGEAMAGQMLAQQVAAVSDASRIALVSTGSHHAHGHDCDEAARAATSHHHGSHDDAAVHADASDHVADPAHASGDCPTCASCQVCSSVALSSSPQPEAAAGLTHPQPQAAHVAYASAEPSLSFKPPRH